MSDLKNHTGYFVTLRSDGKPNCGFYRDEQGEITRLTDGCFVTGLFNGPREWKPCTKEEAKEASKF